METGFIHSIKKNSLPVILLFSLMMPLPAFSHGSHEHSGHEGLVWPPDPRGITDVVVHSDAQQQRTLQSTGDTRMDRMEQKVKNYSSVKRALGKKFTCSTVIDKEDKINGKVISEITFFSYDKNATIKVEIADENTPNEKFLGMTSTPANNYQPEINDEEATEAQNLARNYFLNKGFKKIKALKAYSILAYKPQGLGFYDTRVIYVSFHDNDDSPPEFVAWVDLSRQKILKAREEK